MPAVRHGNRLYKGMALEVAVRNPERYFDFLKTFSKFDGKVLNDECILEIYVQLYLDRVVETSNISEEQLNKEYLREYIKNHNTHNNEWGFPTGYQAAFCRYLKTLSEFGFIYSQYNKVFKLSEVAKAVVNGTIDLSEAFALQSMRFWRKSPYRRVLNDFNYFTFLINSLIKLDSLNRSLSYTQFVYSLFSDDGDVSSLINDLQTYSIGSDQSKAYELIVNKYSLVDSEHGKVAQESSVFRDYANTVFRVIQLTGFITVNYSGIITISVNKNRLDFYNELSKFDFSLSEQEKDDEELYFKKLGSLNKEIISIIEKYREKDDLSTKDYNIKLKSIVETYGLTKELLSEYLLDVVDRNTCRNAFWYMQAPLKLEFYLTIFVYLCYGDNFEYKPNYKCDDAGIPYSHAPGNMGDIEVWNRDTYWLIEATLIRNKTQQMNNETINLFRHISSDIFCDKYITLVAPYIHEDTSLMLNVASLLVAVEQNSKIYAAAQTVSDFVQLGESCEHLETLRGENTELIKTIKQYINSL